MHILILHGISYDQARYDEVISHDSDDVVYIGIASKMGDIPAGLRARRISVADEAEIVATAVAEYRARGVSPDAVIALMEYDIEAAAEIRSQLGVVGKRPADARLVRNKLAMKTAVAAAGICVPEFAPASAVADGHVLRATGPFVLKPTSGALSKNIKTFATLSDVRTAIADRSTGIPAIDVDERVADFEIERYVDGPVLHWDGLVRGGRVLAATTSRYVGTCLDFAAGVPLGSYQTDDLLRTEFLKLNTILEAVRIADGAFHLEMIEGAHGTVFLEIANRAGGSYIPEVFRRKTGVDIVQEDIRIHLGRPSTECRIDAERYFGFLLIPRERRGSAAIRVANRDRLAAHPAVLHATWSDEGELLHRSSYRPQDNAFACVVHGKSASEVENSVTELLRTAKIRPTAV